MRKTPFVLNIYAVNISTVRTDDFVKVRAQYWHHIRMDYTENRARALQSTKHMHLICPLKIS
jgi:hypothetical protein